MSLDDITKSKKIVTYHKVHDLTNFERQLGVIRKAKAILTVDDGDISFYNNVYPLVRKYQIPTILFIVTSLINTEKPFWWDEVQNILGDKKGKSYIKKLKSVPNTKRLELIQTLKRESRIPELRYPQLSLNQLKEMQSSGIVIGNHTHTHPLLDQCTELEIREELKRSKEFFYQNEIDGYSLLAYPNGNSNSNIQTILKEEGVKVALLFDHKLNKGNDPMQISRLSVNDHTSIPKLRFILSGWHSRIVPVTRNLNRLFS